MAGVGVEMLGKPVQDARINVSRRKPFKMRRKGRFVIILDHQQHSQFIIHLLLRDFPGSLTSPFPDGRITLLTIFLGRLKC